MRQRELAIALKFVVAILLLTACIAIAVITPPIQSPDENDHLKRAYLLSKGTLTLNTPRGMSSGGLIDSGLLSFVNSYLRCMPPLPGSKGEGADLRWTGNMIFSPAPGTGYYFPFMYAPQAFALATAEALGLTIKTSYWMARCASLLAFLLLMLAAFSLFPINPFVLALLVIPMTLFQLASASLDGVATGVTLFSVAAFLRLASDKAAAPRWLIYALALAVVLLATTRLHAAPLLLLLPAAAYFRKDWEGVVLFILGAGLFLAWTYYAANNTFDFRSTRNFPPTTIASYYLVHPTDLFAVFYATLANPDYLARYIASFLGRLGWVDADFSLGFYNGLLRLVLLIGVLSLSWRGLRGDWRQRLILFILAVGSIATIFLALLVTWNSLPALHIDGVQGRYFLIPAILLAYAIAGSEPTPIRWGQEVALGLCLSLYLLSVGGTVGLLIARYYAPPAGTKMICSLPDKVTQRTSGSGWAFLPPETDERAAPL